MTQRSSELDLLAGVLPPLEGTLPEPEIYTRLARALSLLPGDDVLAPLREAASRSRPEFAAAFRAFMAATPGAGPVASFILYHALGRCLPAGVAAAAPRWGCFGDTAYITAISAAPSF